ncbi:MAG: peptidoglycan bridge formation glycyltransferase FemA/FemB family protein [Chthonomonadales bacterium]
MTSAITNLTLRDLGSDWDAKWDELVGASPECGLMQSSAWAEFKRLEGYETHRFGFFNDEELIGGANLYDYPYTGREGFLICPEGPLLPWQDTETSRACLRLLQTKAHEIAETNGGLGLRIEPHLTPPAPSILRNWKRAPIDLTPVHTLVLDIAGTPESILAQMKPKGRYNLKLADKHGVTVRQSRNINDLQTFYALFKETAGRNGFFAEPYGFFLNLSSVYFPKNLGELFIAEWQGETLAAILVTYCGMRSTYLYGGSSNQNRQVMPNYLLQWSAVLESRRRGCTEYDFFGYDPFGQTDHLYAGISRFKTQFGGRRMDSIGARDFIFYDRLADKIAGELS